MSAETDLVSVPPSELTAPGINVLPYILLALAGPEEFDLEVIPCLWVLALMRLPLLILFSRTRRSYTHHCNSSQTPKSVSLMKSSV